MNDYPIMLGSMLFTLVEPHREHVVAYNRWYERDHFYAGCLVGPGILAGARWVATRELKKLRYPAESPISPDPRTGSYLATYFIEASMSREWGTWAAEEVHRLHENDRMFPHRDHIHTQMYVYRGGVFREPDGVPPELALDHRFQGLVPVFVDANDGVERKELARWLSEDVDLTDSPAAMCLSWTPIPVPGAAPADVPKTGDPKGRVLQLWFLDTEPSEAWDEHFAGLGERVAAGGLGRVSWAGPFIPTVPGTDTYTDQL